MAGGETEWSGSLRKGESKELAFKLLKTGGAPVERYSIEITSPSLFARLRQYGESIETKTRQDQDDKEFLKWWIAKEERTSLRYQELFDSLIKAGAPERAGGQHE